MTYFRSLIAIIASIEIIYNLCRINVNLLLNHSGCNDISTSKKLFDLCGLFHCIFMEVTNVILRCDVSFHIESILWWLQVAYTSDNMVRVTQATKMQYDIYLPWEVLLNRSCRTTWHLIIELILYVSLRVTKSLEDCMTEFARAAAGLVLR